MTLIAIGKVAAGGPMVARPGRTLVNVQLALWALEPRHAVAAEAVGIWALGHTESTMVTGLAGTALGLWGPTGVAAALCSLASGFWATGI